MYNLADADVEALWLWLRGGITAGVVVRLPSGEEVAVIRRRGASLAKCMYAGCACKCVLCISLLSAFVRVSVWRGCVRACVCGYCKRVNVRTMCAFVTR